MSSASCKWKESGFTPTFVTIQQIPRQIVGRKISFGLNPRVSSKQLTLEHSQLTIVKLQCDVNSNQPSIKSAPPLKPPLVAQGIQRNHLRQNLVPITTDDKYGAKLLDLNKESG
ncbi:hypothetical protein NPIL_492881 [Nephila pilipes]|uniref:Uncharacterized protein n=1 Tax=Nephila pilipes TaxID=299642 RepID=A0A8X6NCM2_NEPPI|nr:hypothetical protein NPIL_492881 [Nephila pilipes]